ncbi:hypothetical protein KL925_004334 [Ogataea polymorpha]|nr:hypothetical protein KL936_004318 [Ogataea polymorpha]KAG7925319.1 hypothetical protein KL925_004334 [Ogataea polymorpha]
MDRGDKNHPEPEPQQKRDKHQGIVLEQAAEACGISSAPEHSPFIFEIAYLGGQVVKRVEPGTLENQKHRAQGQNEHVSGWIVAAAAGENKYLIHDWQAKEPLCVEVPAQSHTCKLFQRIRQRVCTKIARRAGHSEQQQKVHDRRPEPSLFNEKDVEDVFFRGEVIVRRFLRRSKPDQLANKNHYRVQQSDENLKLGQSCCVGHNAHLGVQHLQMSCDRVVLVDGLGHKRAK